MHGLLLQRERVAALLFALIGSLLTVPHGALAATSENGAASDSAAIQLSASELSADGDGEIEHVGLASASDGGSITVTVENVQTSGDGSASAEIEVQNATSLWYKLYVEPVGDVDINFLPFALEDSQGKFLYLPPEGTSSFAYPALQQTVTFNEPNTTLSFTTDRTIAFGFGALALQSWEIISRASGLPALPHDEAGAVIQEIKGRTQGLDPFIDAAVAIRDGDVDGIISAVSGLGRDPAAINAIKAGYDEIGESVTTSQIKSATTVLKIISVSWYIAEFVGETLGSSGGDSRTIKAFDFDTGPTLKPEMQITDGGAPAPAEVSFDAGDSYASEDIESYSWDFGDGSPQAGSETVEHTYTQPGSYDVTLTVTDTEGNTGEITNTVQVFAPRLISDRQTLYEFEFEAEDNANLTGYSWDFGDGSTATGRTPTHTFEDRGNYEVTLTLSLTSGDETEVTRTVYAGPRPVYISGTYGSDRVWPASHGPYVIDGRLTVDTSATLTIEPGAVVKFGLDEDGGQSKWLEVKGELVAEGTAQDSVVFTSIRDDAYGGDTNGDGSETSPSADDWDYIVFNEGSGSISHAVVRYGGEDVLTNHDGATNNYDTGMIFVDDSAPTITDSRITDGLYAGIEVDGGQPVIEDNKLDQNGTYPIIASPDGMSNVSDNTGSGNEINGIDPGGGLSTNTTWPVNEGLPVVVDGKFQVPSETKLMIEPGSVVKFGLDEDGGQSKWLQVRGELLAEGTEQDSVVFTSIRDDDYGGDTNGDGSETSPSADDWDYIVFDEGSGSISHAVVRYGGEDVLTNHDGATNNYDTGMIFVDDSAPTITDSRITDGLYAGIEVDGGQPVIENNQLLQNGAEGLRLAYAGGVVRGNTLIDNESAALRVHEAGGSDSLAVEIRRNVVQDNRAGMHLSGSPVASLGTTSEYGENVFRRNDDYSLKNTAGETVQAVGNYWDATSASAIDNKIYDDDEDSSSGQVIFEPFLEEPPTESIEIASGETGEISLGETGASVSITENSDSDGGELQYRRQDTRPLNNAFEGSATAPDGSTVSPDKVAQRFWRIDAEDLSGVTFSVSLDATGTGGVGLPGQQVILKRGGTDSTWTPLNTTREGDTLSASGLTSFSQFAIGGNPASAPPSEAPMLASPSPGATGVPAVPSLSWDSVGQARQYRVELSPEASFPEATTQSYATPETEYAPPPLQRETTYHWRVRAENSKGESGWSDPRQFTTRVPSVTFDVSQSFGGADEAGDYRLVALPGQVERPLGNAISGETGSEWQAFWDDGSSDNYLVQYDGSDQFTFRPGQGFWLTSRQDWTLSDSVKAVPLGSDQATAIPLHEGWNIISNPLREGIPWSAVQEAHSDSLQPAWAFTGSFEQADTLRSAATGQAYYFLNNHGLDSLKVPYPTSAKSTGKTTLATESKTEKTPDGHKGVMTLVAQKNEALTSEIQVGISSEAASGLGPRDVVAPPARFSAISLRLEPGGDTPARKGLLAAEWRPPASGTEGKENGHTFSLRLWSEIPGPVEIQAKGLRDLKGREVALLDPASGQTWDLRSQESVTIPETDSSALKLAVGSAAYVEGQEQKVVPDEVTLTSYPNPLRRQATIEYTLTEPTDVRVTVYDVLGRRVAVLTDGRKEAGRHRLQLDGGRLASGVYFGRLKTEDQTRTQKITVVR